MNFKLVEPSLDMEHEYIDYISEWENSGEPIVPYASRSEGLDFKSLISKWEIELSSEAYKKGLVPATILFMVDESGRIYGIMHIRHELNDYLKKYSGHLGGGIRPSERNKKLGSKMVSMALAIAKSLGIDRVLVTCNKNNTASAMLIKNLGGILENEIHEIDNIIQRYWIDL